MHQSLVQWIGDRIEVVLGEAPSTVASAELDTYEQTRCIFGEAWDREFLKVADYRIKPIQAVGPEEES